MANYLPVLLISVSTNAVPDDSSLSTLPRAQVDYLSHDWQEEDVWRSWRNMTRQKNEITNGMRLENASWRTWWKQRNKLKTVSPETLNWLKDSDVTWLYGPLHTAVDWTPPPKPLPVPDCIDGPDPPALDRLDLFSPNPTLNPPPCKPILKHRSISELLISNLNPTSPVFSPVDSEDDDDASPIPSSPQFLSFATGAKSKRPILTHTKSDTHITRWGRSAFRKNSPPRIGPPGFDASEAQNQRQTYENTPHLGPISESASQDSNSSGGVGRSSSNGAERTKKKHISFNTYVQQYIAIEKPKKSTSGFFGASQERNWFAGNTTFPVDDGYEEDSEDDSGEDTEQIHRRDTPVMSNYAGVTVDDDDDGIIEIRSSSHRNQSKTKSFFRSQSKVSTASSSSSTSTTTNSSTSTSDATSPSGSLSPCRSNRRPSPSSSSTATARRSGSSTYRPSNTYTPRQGQPPPPLLRSPSEHVHFTIAPIAPTILKTTGVWSEGFGDEEGNEDEFGSWDPKGLWSGQDTAGNGKRGKGKTAGLYGSFGMVGGESDKEGQSSEGTPVELVYVPPFESNYSLGMGDDGDIEEYKEPRDVIGRKAQVYQTGVTRNVGLTDSNGTSIPSPSTSPSELVSSRGSRIGHRRWSSTEVEYGCYAFAGPDLGDDYYHARRSDQDHDGVFPLPSSSATALGGGGGLSASGNERQRERERDRRTVVQGGEERQSRSRSRSQSRTPSPAYISSSVSTAPTPTASNGQAPRKRSSSASATQATPSILAGPDLLFPPRGRTLTPQSQPLLSQPQSRGRSSTRTTSSSSSFDREGSLVGSPIGCLSIDGLVRTGGREKEKDREIERGRERRGRERTSEKILAGSEIEPAVSLDSKFPSTTSSCSSSTSTVMGLPSSDAIGVDVRPELAPSNPSPTKLRLPPLILPPPHLVRPSTSFTAVSTSTPASPIINTFTTATSKKGLASPTTSSSGEHTIVGKAVDIVSSAGVFLGLWQHSSKSEG